jgi:hypothetical protein
VALFTKPWKKGARNFFQKFQDTAAESFTFLVIWQGKCPLATMESYLTHEVTPDS